MSIFKALQPRMFTFSLFKFYRCGGLGGDVVENTVYAANLVDDAHGHLIQHLVRNAHPIRGHKVRGRHRTQRQRVIVGTAVAHDADGAHIRERREILAHGVLQSALRYLVAENVVRFSENVQLLFRDLADDADAEAGAGERLALDKRFRQAKLAASTRTSSLNSIRRGSIISLKST